MRHKEIKEKIIAAVESNKIISEVELLDILNIAPGEMFCETFNHKRKKIKICYPFPQEIFFILKDLGKEKKVISLVDNITPMPLNFLDGLAIKNRLYVERKGKWVLADDEFPQFTNFVFCSYSYFKHLPPHKQNRVINEDKK